MAADGEAQARAMLSAGAPKMQQSVVPPSPVRPAFVTPAREEDGLIQALQARPGEQQGGSSGHRRRGAAMDEREGERRPFSRRLRAIRPKLAAVRKRRAAEGS